METVNGKLINQEVSRLDELTQTTERIKQRCEHLEHQLTISGRKDNKQYLQKLEQKISFLEELTSNQANQLLFIKIGSFIGLVVLTFILSTNNQPKNHKSQPNKRAESIEFIQP